MVECLWTKGLWVRIQLQSLKLMISCLLQARHWHSGNYRVWISLKCLRDMIRAYSLLLILIVGLLLVLWFLLLLICTIFKIFCLVSQLHAVHISLLLLFHFFDYLVVSIISALPLFLALLAWFLFWLSLTAIIISPQFNVL